MADAIVINKADGENTKATKIAKVEFTRALHLYPPKDNGWIPKVLSASSLYNKGIDAIYTMVENYFELTKSNGFFEHRRNEQNKEWLFITIENHLKDNFFTNKTIKKALEEELKKLKMGKTTPFHSAKSLLKNI